MESKPNVIFDLHDLMDWVEKELVTNGICDAVWWEYISKAGAIRVELFKGTNQPIDGVYPIVDIIRGWLNEDGNRTQKEILYNWIKRDVGGELRR